MSFGSGHMVEMIARMRFNKQQAELRKGRREKRKNHIKTSNKRLPRHDISEEELRIVRQNIRAELKIHNARERRFKIILFVCLLLFFLALLLIVKYVVIF